MPNAKGALTALVYHGILGDNSYGNLFLARLRFLDGLVAETQPVSGPSYALPWMRKQASDYLVRLRYGIAAVAELGLVMHVEWMQSTLYGSSEGDGREIRAVCGHFSWFYSTL